MKQFISVILFLLPLFSGAQIGLSVKNYSGDVIFARYHLGKVYPVDTLKSDNSFYIYCDKKQKEGIYLFIMDKKYIEFPLGIDQNFKMMVDFNSQNILSSTQITGSKDNSLFLSFINQKTPEDKEAFQRDNIKNIEDPFLSAYMKALTPVLPPKGVNDTVSFYFSRTHFWDNVDFTIPQMINSPLISGKLDFYFNNMLPQQPDSVITHMNRLLNYTMADTIRHAVLDWLLSYTFENKTMGMEKAFVWLAEKYFLNNCGWLKETTMKTIKEQYAFNKYCLVGNQAAELRLTDSNGNPFILSQQQSNYTLLLFYDISCGTCKKVVEELHDKYSSLFLKGVQIVALNTELESEKWREYIKQHDIGDWINVMDFDNSTNYHTLYGVQSTPMVYLLDKNKKIIGKKLTIDQVNLIINNLKN